MPAQPAQPAQPQPAPKSPDAAHAAESESADFLIIGGGIAGLSMADELSRLALPGTHITLLEAEDVLAYHTSSRAAQQLTPSYGPEAVQEMTKFTMGMLEDTTEGLSGTFTWPSSLMIFGTQKEVAAELYPGMTTLTAAEVAQRAPELHPAEAGGLEPYSVRIRATEFIDFLADRAQRRGVRIITGARVTQAQRDPHADQWRVQTPAGEFGAKIIINAAGAWADEVAETFGAARVGLTPMRRTAVEAKISQPLDPAHPLTQHAGLGFYYRPDPLGVVASIGEEEPSGAEDAQPRDEDVEGLLHNLRTYTSMDPQLLRAWCGLRTVSADGEPVVGFDPVIRGLFWLAGQSGYGFQTSLGMARLASELVLNGKAGDWISARSVTLLDPARFHRA